MELPPAHENRTVREQAVRFVNERPGSRYALTPDGGVWAGRQFRSGGFVGSEEIGRVPERLFAVLVRQNAIRGGTPRYGTRSTRDPSVPRHSREAARLVARRVGEWLDEWTARREHAGEVVAELHEERPRAETNVPPHKFGHGQRPHLGR